MVEIVIDGQRYEVPDDVFRKLIVTTQFNLNKLQQIEKKGFPATDKAALDLCFKLQFKHKQFI